MMVDMSNVSWLTKPQIDLKVHELLNRWAIFIGEEVKPPIPVEAIAEKYLGLIIEYDNLEEILGIPDVLGATWVEEKRMVVNKSLLEGVEGRITFTCGHEIAHWILHRKYLLEQSSHLNQIENEESPAIICRISTSKSRGEWQADYFSACLLMPQGEVENAYERAFGTAPIFIYNEKSCFGRNNPVVIDPALDTAKEIAQKVVIEGKFTNVSKEAMCYRLNELGLLINLAGKSLVEQFRSIKPSITQNKT
jgi:Zn-dependent peptidase ImmA (M78 family)